MSAELVIRPGHVEESWESFLASHPIGAVAFDGYTKSASRNLPVWEPGGPKANFDHHEGARHSMSSTAQQMLRAIRLGFVEAFTRDGDYCPIVFMNDCDQDNSLAWYMVDHGLEIAAQRRLKEGRAIRRLADVAGDLDVTAGAYPYPRRMKTVREVSWIFRPYTEARAAGLPRDAEGQRQIIDECCGRIGLHLAGQGGEVELDRRFQVLGGDKRWTMFAEIGAEGRIGAFQNDINAFVIYKGQRAGGTHDYSIGRISEFIDFDVQRLVFLLNKAEGLSGVDRWGCDGSGIIGGSPRAAGSRLGPDEVSQIINKALKNQSRK